MGPSRDHFQTRMVTVTRVNQLFFRFRRVSSQVPAVAVHPLMPSLDPFNSTSAKSLGWSQVAATDSTTASSSSSCTFQVGSSRPFHFLGTIHPGRLTSLTDYLFRRVWDPSGRISLPLASKSQQFQGSFIQRYRPVYAGTHQRQRVGRSWHSIKQPGAGMKALPFTIVGTTKYRQTDFRAFSKPPGTSFNFSGLLE